MLKILSDIVQEQQQKMRLNVDGLLGRLAIPLPVEHRL